MIRRLKIWWDNYKWEYGRVGLSAARRHKVTGRVYGHVAGNWLRARRDCWSKFQVQK